MALTYFNIEIKLITRVDFGPALHNMFCFSFGLMGKIIAHSDINLMSFAMNLAMRVGTSGHFTWPLNIFG